MTLARTPMGFSLPEASVASEPAEVRGEGRDDVRLMVTSLHSGVIEHDRFPNLARHLLPGDVLVVNTSATVPAAIAAVTEDGSRFKLHFASPAAGGLWQVEVRSVVDGGGTAPGPDLAPQTLRLPAGAEVHLLARSPRAPRLWVAAFEGADDADAYLHEHGEPVRYAPGPQWPMETYQTVFATEPGSAEMPSAARPFTTDMVTRLISRGVVVAPVVLHAGVSSYEEGEAPGEERFEMPVSTAAVANTMRARGGRVIAVGTTVVRALETVVDDHGGFHPGQGLTDIVIGPGRPVRGIDGMLTGWHEPKSSHLELLEALLPRPQLRDVYDEALGGEYLWHEFGDSLLILP